MTSINLGVITAEQAGEIARIEAHCGSRVHACYQCGTCSAGCPMAESMDILPRQVIRYLQLGLVEEALHSHAPWICAACHTCSSRCPHDINICGLMEAVRQAAGRRGLRPVRTVSLFSRFFLLPVKYSGRSHEITLTALYNIFSGHLLQNFGFVPQMLRGRKAKLIPDFIKGRGAVKQIMERCEEERA